MTGALIGFVVAIANWGLGAIGGYVLLQLLAGGVPGVVVGCLLSKMLPAQKMKTAVALIALCAGLLLVRTGVQTFTKSQATHPVRLVALPSGHNPL